MNARKLIILAVGAASAFVVGYGAVAQAWPTPYYTGYFTGSYDTAGTHIMQPDSDTAGCAGDGTNSLPTYIDTANEFINFVKCRLTSTNSSAVWRTMERTGAAFIIQTMLQDTGSKITSTADPRVVDWEGRVRYYEQQGWVTWNWSGFGYAINTFYQGSRSSSSPNDDAFYANNGSSLAMVFSNAYGGTYVIRRQCFNPIGGLNALTDNPVFDMSATSRVSAPGFPEAQNISVPAGTQVTFTHRLTASGSTFPSSINWSTYTQGDALVGSGSAGTFTNGEVKSVGSQTFTPAPGVYCRYLSWLPDTQAGGSANNKANQACVTVTADFDLQPFIRVDVNGAPASSAEPGDTVAFVYSVNNSASGASAGTACTIYGSTHTGHYDITSPADTTSDAGFSQPAHGCPRNFPGGGANTVLVTETLPAASVVANRSICRTLLVTPATPSGAAATLEVCAFIAAKPYARIYRGDISAGGGLVTSPDALNSCSRNTGAAVIGWNRRAATWSGAGAQFAIYAMNTIFDTSSALVNTGGAPRPNGLAFANTGVGADTANGNYGGSLGSVGCVADHFSTLPVNRQTLGASTSVNGLSGAYYRNGNLDISGGTINTGAKVDVFVEGNVFISNQITFGGSGSWNSGNIPSFRLIVKGNIFVDNNVARLDGLYVAQPNGSSDGIIYTCATAANTVMSLTGSLGNQCDTKLIVNGSFVARQVWLLRTAGTQRNSTANEDAASGNMAEAFIYGPSSWMIQPANTSGSAEYDAITTLPPVL